MVSQIYSDGARIGADIVLTYSYLGVYSTESRFNANIYLFDIKNRRVYEAAGNQENHESVTGRLFQEFITS